MRSDFVIQIIFYSLKPSSLLSFHAFIIANKSLILASPTTLLKASPSSTLSSTNRCPSFATPFATEHVSSFSSVYSKCYQVLRSSHYSMFRVFRFFKEHLVSIVLYKFKLFRSDHWMRGMLEIDPIFSMDHPFSSLSHINLSLRKHLYILNSKHESINLKSVPRPEPSLNSTLIYYICICITIVRTY